MKCYQLRAKLVKGENCDLLPGFHITFNKWKNHMSTIECT